MPLICDALTREDLDNSVCNRPGCTHQEHPVLELSPPCHNRAALTVHYDKRTGRLAFACERCRRPVCQVAVARSELVN